MSDEMKRIEAMMAAAGMADTVVRTFCFHYRRLLDGASGTLSRNEIVPVAEVPDLETLAATGKAGGEILERVAVVKLNGGLGTSMGLERAKSLLPVRDGLSFLELIARQMLALRAAHHLDVPLLFMNSFRTAEDTERMLATFPELPVAGLPLGFLQHKVPKILADELAPLDGPGVSELAWCPPGHGDVYTALDASGLLDHLLARGVEYAFISNADNLGAVLDPAILGHMIAQDADFLMEVSDRTAADRKGGHLCRLHDGRLALRESAQCPPGEADEFQDVARYRYFNTNNIWVRLSSLRRVLDTHRGVLQLDTIVNRKTLDPRDPASPPVVQLETAMGAAISLFPRAQALRVPRHRFSPVKTTDDLLGVRSDAYVLSGDSRVCLAPEREAPPVIFLDPEVYRMIDAFDARFAAGIPSLRHCRSLTVQGDVVFGSDVVLEGDVVLQASTPAKVAPGARLSGTHRLS